MDDGCYSYCFAAVQTMRKHNPGLATHAHRAMHGLR